MKRYLMPALFCVLVTIAGCRDTGQVKSPAEDASGLSKSELKLKTQITALKDSLDSNWQRMSESDERKMASIKRLLDEISYTPRYNAIRQRQLLQAHGNVKAMRYDMKTMADSDLIDRYDAAQDSLVNGVLTLAAETPEVEKFPLITELSTDIQSEHNKTIIFRIRHDGFGREINQILSQSGRKVQRLGEPYASMQKVPLFTLSGT